MCVLSLMCIGLVLLSCPYLVQGYIHVCVKSHVYWACVVVLSILGARLHACVC